MVEKTIGVAAVYSRNFKKSSLPEIPSVSAAFDAILSAAAPVQKELQAHPAAPALAGALNDAGFEGGAVQARFPFAFWLTIDGYGVWLTASSGRSLVLTR